MLYQMECYLVITSSEGADGAEGLLSAGKMSSSEAKEGGANANPSSITMPSRLFGVNP